MKGTLARSLKRDGIVLFAALLVFGASSALAARSNNIHELEYYDFNPASPVADRIVAIPPSMLTLYKKMDGKTDYKPYVPLKEEKAVIMAYFDLLPPVYLKVFKERCVGIYFIENFTGNGLANWVIDKSGRVYFHIVLNPQSMRESLSETLTKRERSSFVPDGGGAVVTVNAGKEYNGLAYSLFHEATHGVDLVKRVTPYTDPGMPKHLLKGAARAGDFFKRRWSDYYTPAGQADFPLRENITFYGLGGGPKLMPEDAPRLYQGLASSPFVSLYGSRNWAEDFAELVSLQLVAGVLRQPYVISVKGPSGTLTFKPLSSPTVRKRAESMIALLESLN